MSAKRERVDRPLKPAEYEIRFANRDAEKGWRDLLAVARHPHEGSKRCYALKADYAVVNVSGVDYEQWQYKVTDGARVWYCVVPSSLRAKPKPRVAGVVYLFLSSPGHPKGTE